MISKRLAIIGFITLVIIGSVLAAGCTSNTTQQTQTSETITNNPWIGLWGTEYNFGDGTTDIVALLIKQDKTAIWSSYGDSTTSKITEYNEETWKKISENKIALTNTSTGKTYYYEYDSKKDTLTEINSDIVNVSNVYNRFEPILGTWGTIGKNLYDGNKITTFLVDGTGKEEIMYITDEVEGRTFTWKQTGINTYNLVYDNGDVWQVKVINDDKQLDWELITLKDQILGTRSLNYEQDGMKINNETTFNDNFTGVSVGTYVDASDKETYNEKFTWKKSGINTYILTYENGNRWIGVYNKKDNTVDYTLNDLSDEPIVGTHKQDGTEFGIDGTIETTFYANGTGKEVHISKDGISETYDIIWNKTDTKNKYRVLYYGENLCEFWTEFYNTQTKTLESKLEYYIWNDNYRYTDRHYLDIHSTNDKTGVAYEYEVDGTMKEYKTTWEEVKPNVFKITYSDGDVWYAIYSPLTDTYEWKEEL